VNAAWLLTKYSDAATATAAIALLLLAGCQGSAEADKLTPASSDSWPGSTVCTLRLDIPPNAQSNPTGPDDGWLYIDGKRWQLLEIPYNGKCIEETET